jgi:hypothetical protein
MAYQVDWAAKSIYIPLADLIFEGGSVYTLRLYNDFRKEIRRLEWEFSEGLWAPQIMSYTDPLTFSGITLSAAIQIINGYTITFEDAAVDVLLREANSNLVDVTVRNQVRPIPFNTAGYVIAETGTSGLTPSESTQLNNIDSRTSYHTKVLDNKRALEKDGNTWYLVVYDDDNSTVILKKALKDVTDADIGTPATGVPSVELKTIV